MPTVSRAYIDAFTRRIDALSNSARITLSGALADVDAADVDEVARIMRYYCRPYTDMSAALTAEFYDGIRLAAGAPGTYRAEAISGYSDQSLTAAVVAVLDEAEQGGGESTLAQMMGALADREINDATRECVRRNASRDPAKPKCASVPTSSNPCEWCVMRASAGFIYDQDSGSHSHCKCRLVPGFKGSAKVEGYDQEAYGKQWNDAADAYRKGDISPEMGERIAAAKQKHAEDLAAGRASKKWDDTNAILMVMREQAKE